MAVPSETINRMDLASTFHEFDLAMARRKFIGPQCLRPRLVGVQAADITKIPIESLLELKDDARAPGAGYRRGDFRPTKFAYATEEHGWEEPMDDRTVAIYGDLFDAEEIHAARAADFVLRNYEIAVAAALYDTAVWTGAGLTTSLTNEWDDKTNATPIDDVEAARLLILAASGLEPNALILNRKQFFSLRNCAQIVDRLITPGRNDPHNVNTAMMAQILDLEMVLVAGGDNIKASNKEGQDVTTASIWGDEHMMLAKVAVTDDPKESCVGRTFIWTGDGPGTPGDERELALAVEEYREETIRGSVIRVRNDRDIVIMYPQAAHLLSNAITI